MFGYIGNNCPQVEKEKVNKFKPFVAKVAYLAWTDVFICLCQYGRVHIIVTCLYLIYLIFLCVGVQSCNFATQYTNITWIKHCIYTRSSRLHMQMHWPNNLIIVFAYRVCNILPYFDMSSGLIQSFGVTFKLMIQFLTVKICYDFNAIRKWFHHQWKSFYSSVKINKKYITCYVYVSNGPFTFLYISCHTMWGFSFEE